jgi:hypothetical protein
VCKLAFYASFEIKTKFWKKMRFAQHISYICYGSQNTNSFSGSTMNVRTWQIVQRKRKKVVFAIITFLNGMFHIYRSGYIIRRSNITFREGGKSIVHCSVVKGQPVCKTFTGFSVMRLKKHTGAIIN